MATPGDFTHQIADLAIDKEQRKEQSFRDYLSEIKELLKEWETISGDRSNFVKVLSEKKLDEWKSACVDVAIIGNSGVGKSTFINAYLGLKHNDERAAGTGVTETTVKPYSYKAKENPNVKLWDLPGVGTPNHPKERYLEAIGFDKYDIFIVMAAHRFTENDMWIVSEIEKSNRAFFFVRTHVWNDYTKEKQAKGDGISPHKIILKIREDCELNLPGYKDKIYLIDSLKPTVCILDFGKLKESMAMGLSNEKREALLKVLGVGSEEMIKMHAEIMRRRIKWRVIMAGIGGLVPVPGASVFINSSIMSSLKGEFAQRLGLTINTKFQANLKNLRVSENGKDRVMFIITECLKKCVTDATEKVASNAGPLTNEMIKILRWIPVLSSPATLARTYLAANFMLDHMVSVALEVNRVIYEDIIKHSY